MRFLLLSFFAFPWMLSAQQVLKFDLKTHHFGNVQAWDNPPAVFQFTNTSSEAQYILAPRYGRKVYVDYPTQKIEPGSSGQISVVYYTDQTGSFSEEIILYASGSSTPETLVIKGNIKTLAGNALTACPDFSAKKGNDVAETLIEGLVIDKKTQEPIPGAAVAFSYEKGLLTDKGGEFKTKLLMGLYQFHIWSEGYTELIQAVGIKRFNDKLVFELEKAEQSPNLTTEIIDNKKDSIVIPENDDPDFSVRDYRPNNIILLVDVSGSMKKDGKIDSLKSAMQNLVGLMRSLDNVSLIAFSSYTREIFLDQTGEQKSIMAAKVDSLSAKGTTNGILGIENAYTLAAAKFIPEGNNIVIVATDGIFADASGSDGGFKKLAEQYLKKGIKLSVIGFGEDSKGVERMKTIAIEGGGNYISFNKGEEASSKLVDEIKTQARR